MRGGSGIMGCAPGGTDAVHGAEYDRSDFRSFPHVCFSFSTLPVERTQSGASLRSH